MGLPVTAHTHLVGRRPTSSVRQGAGSFRFSGDDDVTCSTDLAGVHREGVGLCVEKAETAQPHLHF